MIGSYVKNLVMIQSDDRAFGVDDSSATIPTGSIGVVVGWSKDHLDDGTCLKEGCEDSIVVQFDTPSGVHTFDVLPTEVCLVQR